MPPKYCEEITMFDRKLSLFAGLTLFTLLSVSGCGDKGAGKSPEAAALVNGQVVAAEQIENELKKLGQVPPEQSRDIANRILKNVLDQELLAQQAVQTKLADKSEVRMKIDAARRQILAEAQIEAMAKDMPAPTDAEIKAYFDANPELFAKRKVFKLQELVATTSPDNVEQVRELAKQAKDSRELVASLRAKGVQVGARELAKAAEELPADLLKRLSALKTGQFLSVLQGNKLDVIVVVGAEERPASLEKASAMISRYLVNTRKREHIEAEIGKLRGKAKIEYKPPYAAMTADKEANQVKP
jgi:EpsD family peptidyl-prolyl cis-trans isomerase